jgi:small subunit ribosomal protein S16
LSVRLRLRRMGKKKQPVYKVVAADSRSPRDGKFLEAVGLYNPLTKPHTVEIEEDRVLYWLDKGAQPTDTVKSLLRQKGITLKRELSRRGLSAEQINSEIENWTKLQEAKQRSTAKKKKSKKSVDADQKPAEADQKPVEAEQKPVEAEQKPAKAEQKSVDAEQKGEEVSKDENNEQSTAEVQGASEEGSIPKE